MLQLGMIGCGKMGGAMLRQILAAGKMRPEEILISDKNPALREQLRQELGVEVTADNAQAAAAPCLILAVKPQFIQAVGEDIAPRLNPNGLIISIVAGYDMGMLHALLGRPDAHLVRVMPNTPVLVGEGALAAARGAHVTDEEWRFALDLLSCMGMAEAVPEKLMDAVTGLSGSSPAFVFLFLEALADAGVRGGMPRDMAQRFAVQTLLGSAKLAKATGRHPGQLKDMVTSPAGTTIEGVAALEKDGFRFAVMDAVDAAIQKSKSFHS